MQQPGLKDHDIPIRWGGPMLYFNGLASHARMCINALDRYGVSLSLESFGIEKQFAAQLAPAELEQWQRLLSNPARGGLYVVFALPGLADGTNVFELSRLNNPGFSAYVGICTFETDRLPGLWHEACSSLDELWVPSTFNRSAFSRSGIDPRRIQVFPTGIDTEIWSPKSLRSLEISGRRGFAFLSVFQWTKRKGWDVLIKAYLSAFHPDEDVCLILRTYPHLIKEPPIRERIDSFIRSLGRDLKRNPPIIVMDQFVPESHMPALYAAADAFVLPTRGEGFGLPFMEAMAMELPVIATRWGGHLDFMNDGNSYLIDLEGIVPIHPEQTAESPFYTPDHRWAEPSESSTAALMRYVFENREAAKNMGRKARIDMERHWPPIRTADWMAKRAAYLVRSRRGP